MTEVVIHRHPERKLELVLDTDDIAFYSAPRDAWMMPPPADGNAVHRELGLAHLLITFKPGKCARWREMTCACEPGSVPGYPADDRGLCGECGMLAVQR